MKTAAKFAVVLLAYWLLILICGSVPSGVPFILTAPSVLLAGVGCGRITSELFP